VRTLNQRTRAFLDWRLLHATLQRFVDAPLSSYGCAVRVSYDSCATAVGGGQFSPAPHWSHGRWRSGYHRWLVCHKFVNSTWTLEEEGA